MSERTYSTRAPYPTPFTLQDGVLIVHGRRLRMPPADFVKQIVIPLTKQGYEALTVQSTYRIIDPKRLILNPQQTSLLRHHGVTYIVTKFAAKKRGGTPRKAHLGKVKRLLQQGWSQSAIARDLGVSQGAISQARNLILLNAAKRGEVISLPRRGKSSFSTPKRRRV